MSAGTALHRHRPAGDQADFSAQDHELAADRSDRLPLLQVMERAVADAPDHQVSLTDPDARAMATNGKGTGTVGYNLQAAVDAKHHLIIAHEVTNVGHE